MSPLDRLSRWYQSQCNDDWEHQYGVQIDTIDNPGWSVRIDLQGTDLQGRALDEVKIDRSDTDWIRCRLVNNQFEAHGGASNLSELLTRFVDWAEAAKGN